MGMTSVSVRPDLSPPLLVVVTGVPGTGKSKVAEAVAGLLGAAVLAHEVPVCLRSDEVREIRGGSRGPHGQVEQQGSQVRAYVDRPGYFVERGAQLEGVRQDAEMVRRLGGARVKQAECLQLFGGGANSHGGDLSMF